VTNTLAYYGTKCSTLYFKTFTAHPSGYGKGPVSDKRSSLLRHRMLHSKLLNF